MAFFFFVLYMETSGTLSTSTQSVSTFMGIQNDYHKNPILLTISHLTATTILRRPSVGYGGTIDGKYAGHRFKPRPVSEP